MNPKDFIIKQIADMEAKRVSLVEEFDASTNALTKSGADLGAVKARMKALTDQLAGVRKELTEVDKVNTEAEANHDRWESELEVFDIQLNALKAYLEGS